jgi:hypothetical protein
LKTFAALGFLSNFVAQPDGSFDLGFEPNSKRTAWLLGLVGTCLRGGIERHREVHSRKSHAPTPAAA